MRASLFVATVLVTLTAVAAVASAQAVPAAPSHPASPRAPRSISVTISPLHLLSPILEVTGELAAGPRLGIAALGGIGGSSATTGSNDTVRLFALEVGASVRYYATGSFNGGVQVGAEAIYVYLKVDSSTSDAEVTGAGDGLSIGPFVGYKWISRGGFTFDGQGGLAYLAVKARASDGATSSTASDNRIYPLLNVNVGWSF